METWDRIVDGDMIEEDESVVCEIKLKDSTVVAIDLSYAKNRGLSSSYVKNYIKKCGFNIKKEVLVEIAKILKRSLAGIDFKLKEIRKG